MNQANLTAHVRTFAGAGLQELLGEVSAVAEHADAMISLADQHSLGYWRLNGLFLRACGLALTTSGATGVSANARPERPRLPMGVSWHQIRYLCMLSATLQNPDAAETGLRVIAEARELVAGHEEHLWEAELQRIEAELLAFCGSAAERESGYLAALATARRQAAKSLELRAAVGLTRLWTSPRSGAGSVANCSALCARRLLKDSKLPTSGKPRNCLERCIPDPEENSVAVQSPETTQGRDARSTVAEMESQETAGSTSVNSYVACLMLALFRHAEAACRCPVSGVKRKSDFDAWRHRRGADKARYFD